MSECLVTGVVRDLSGNIVANGEIQFARQTDVFLYDGSVRQPDLVNVRTDGSGAISVPLVPGNYRVSLRTNQGQRSFRIAVPELATAFLGDLMTPSAAEIVVITPLVVQAQEAAANAAASEASAQIAAEEAGAAADRAEGYATRAAFVVANTATPGLGLTDGQVVTAAGLQYRRLASSTAIPDLPGWVPITPATAHWATRAQAVTWATANGTTIIDSASSALRYIVQDVTPPNANMNSGAIQIARRKTTTGEPPQALSVYLDLDVTTLDADTQGIAISAGATSRDDTSVYRSDAVAIRGEGSIANGNTRGRAWGGLFAASVNPGGGGDGRLNAIELDVSNYGGTAETDPDSLLAKNAILIAQADPAVSATATKNTAIMVVGNATPGWHEGFVLRRVHNRFIWAGTPSSSGARLIETDTSANWASAMIVLPSGKGFGTWDNAGTTSRLLFSGADNGTVAQIQGPARVETAGSSTLIVRNNVTLSGATSIGSLRFDAVAGNGSALSAAASIAASITSATLGAEASTVTVNTRVAGAATVEATFGGGFIVGTGATRGVGTIAAQNSYWVGANQVVSARRTGWTAPTGTATRTSFDTATVTTAQLAERVKGLIDDLITHGLIGA